MRERILIVEDDPAISKLIDTNSYLPESQNLLSRIAHVCPIRVGCSDSSLNVSRNEPDWQETPNSSSEKNP